MAIVKKKDSTENKIKKADRINIKVKLEKEAVKASVKNTN